MTIGWKGVFPAVTTQLREDLSIDLADTQRVVDDLIRDGVTGVIAGLVAAAGAALLGPWDLVLSWRVAAVALMACGLLGLAVGVMPAARAARLEPIESLRLH